MTGPVAGRFVVRVYRGGAVSSRSFQHLIGAAEWTHQVQCRWLAGYYRDRANLIGESRPVNNLDRDIAATVADYRTPGQIYRAVETTLSYSARLDDRNRCRVVVSDLDDADAHGSKLGGKS